MARLLEMASRRVRNLLALLVQSTNTDAEGAAAGSNVRDSVRCLRVAADLNDMSAQVLTLFALRAPKYKD